MLVRVVPVDIAAIRVRVVKVDPPVRVDTTVTVVRRVTAHPVKADIAVTLVRVVPADIAATVVRVVKVDPPARVDTTATALLVAAVMARCVRRARRSLAWTFPMFLKTSPVPILIGTSGDACVP